MRPGKLLLTLLLTILTLALQGRSLEEIKRSGKIYVAFTRDDLKNINYALAYEFARYLNVELIEVVIEWEEVFMKDGAVPPGMETDRKLVYTPDALKKADIICSTFTIMEWRRRLFGFAETLQSAELLVIHREHETPQGYQELAGKRIAFVGSTTFEQHLSEISGSISGDIHMVPTENSTETKRLLQENRVYGIVLDADEALNFIAGNDQRYKIGFPISEITRTAWAVHKNNRLSREVENFFETITSNGVLDEIFYRKFGITYSSYVDRLNKNLRQERYRRDLDEILESGKLVIALRDRKFVYHEGGQKQFMHALAEEFADYLGVALEFVITPDFEKYWEAADGSVYRDSIYTPEWFNYFDLACEVFAPLDWRTNKVDMVPVYPSSYAVVARKETKITSLDDLEALQGVTGSETVYEDLLRQNGIANFYYERFNNFVPDVAAGKADYTIIYNAFYELSEFPDLEVKLDLGHLDVCWGLRKDQSRLEDEVRQFISQSRENGLIGVLLKALRGNTLQAPEAFIHSYYESFQTGQLPYVNYGADDGLPQEDVFSIFQDHRRYLWFGTNSGVVRFNGREMVVFDQAHGLPGNSVRDIEQDSSGTLYFATTGGIAKFRDDTVTGTLLEGISFNRIFIDSQNRKWFISNEGLYLVTPQGDLRFLNAEFPALPDIIYQITEDRESTHLLLATVQGVFVYDMERDSFTRLSDKDSYSLFIDANDSLWISTREGLYITYLEDLMEKRDGADLRNLNSRLDFPVDIVSDIVTNKFGSVWLVTDSRILQIISTDQDPIIYEQEIGIKNNKILSFLIDHEDNIWIGFSGGLQRLTNRRGLRNFYPGTINSYIYSVFEDDMNRIWINSDNGIFYFSGDELVNFTPRTGSSTNTKFTGTRLPGGQILLANSEGMYELDARSLKIQKHKEFDQVTPSLANIFVTGRGEIFLLTGIHGIIYYFPSFDEEPIQLKNRYTANVFQLIEYGDRVIGGNNHGFVEFNGDRFELLSEIECSLWSLEKEGTRIWVGTDCGIGLVREGRFDQMELSVFAEELVIKSILPARNRNYLWLGTNKGFSYFHTRTQELEFTIDTKDGLSGDEITPGGLFIDHNDLLWIGTYHGISNFNIRAKSSTNIAPVCYIERMYLNGTLTDAVDGRVFSHKENNLVFEISALSFSDEASVEYEYYLRGTGHTYSSYHRGTEYRAYYNNLPAGKYEFIYKAKGKNNIWGYAEKYEFTIRKAWYNTWVFRISMFLLFLFLAYLFYLIRIRTIKAQKNRLEQQVRERTHELEVANTEIEAQRDFARYQHDQIAQQQKSIMDSIQYAQTIQSSLLPSSGLLEDLLPEHFVLFKPRDVVSGDFYWIREQGQFLYFAAADCTGHGVPGAFMSMLGMTLLNEILVKSPGIGPASLMDRLRSRIIETLHQKGDPGSSKDGMDMVLCRYERNRGRVAFSGANNPLYLVRDEELIEYKTDKMPVSIHEIMDPYNEQEIDIRPADRIFLFSDGYADQFGGPRGRKFKYRSMKELFVKHSGKPMQEVGVILDRTFEEWKGELEQIDDVVVIGLKF